MAIFDLDAFNQHAVGRLEVASIDTKALFAKVIGYALLSDTLQSRIHRVFIGAEVAQHNDKTVAAMLTTPQLLLVTGGL